MRHLKSGRALGVKPAHRRAMMRNLVTSLLEHEQITTTVARAKEMRSPLEKMITLGKKGDLAARRRALAFIKTKKAMTALFDELPERYAERLGGYCRIVRVGRRQGDGAEMALIQMVDAPNDALAHAEKPASPRRRRGKGKQVQAEVAEQVQGKGKGKAGKKDKEAKAEVETVQDNAEEAAAAEDQAVAQETQPESGANEDAAESVQTAAQAAPEESSAAEDQSAAKAEAEPETTPADTATDAEASSEKVAAKGEKDEAEK